MNGPREEWALDTRRLGRRVLVYEQLGSTSTLAASLADDPGNDGLAILADEQTAGRGQHGRTWTAPPRASVLLSVLLFPPRHLLRAAVLTAWAAVAVCETVRRTVGVPARIKWPNDVLLQGRKVCGILIEQGRGVVVGIGLNVRQRDADFAAAGLPEAVSLAAFAAAPPETADVARQLLRELDEDYHALCQGDLATLEARWKWHLGLLGRQVRAECVDGCHEGRLCEAAFDGIVLERDGGGLLVLTPEKIAHLDARWS
jgi:BirA family biotin operon repressor/biotin-[acetyl-CoA-carboxylase] ligase